MKLPLNLECNIYPRNQISLKSNNVDISPILAAISKKMAVLRQNKINLECHVYTRYQLSLKSNNVEILPISEDILKKKMVAF